MPSLVTPTEVKALVQTSLTDSELQTVIDREEAWLAGRIGALSGSRTETFYPTRGAEPLFLRRPAPSVTVTDDGDAVDLGEDDGEYRLLYGGTVVHRINTDWGDKVTVTYTPNDSAAVKTAVIDLIRLRITDTGFVSERIGAYSYQTNQRSGAREETREAIVRSLMARPRYRSERLVSGRNR